jgi:signal transduction histidine kinase
VDELLDVSQMESGAVAITCGETDLERLLTEVIENLKPQLQQKELLFEKHFAAKLPSLRVDKDKITAALVNLLGNAVKYTPEKGIVRFLVEFDETNVHFHIEDTGIGISAEDLPRIAEKFFRSSDSRVQRIIGSGLGLAFSQEVARLHRGRISIKSELNKGSRFTMTLPLS